MVNPCGCVIVALNNGIHICYFVFLFFVWLFIDCVVVLFFLPSMLCVTLGCVFFLAGLLLVWILLLF